MLQARMRAHLLFAATTNEPSMATVRLRTAAPEVSSSRQTHWSVASKLLGRGPRTGLHGAQANKTKETTQPNRAAQMPQPTGVNQGVAQPHLSPLPAPARSCRHLP